MPAGHMARGPRPLASLLHPCSRGLPVISMSSAPKASQIEKAQCTVSLMKVTMFVMHPSQGGHGICYMFSPLGEAAAPSCSSAVNAIVTRVFSLGT